MTNTSKQPCFTRDGREKSESVAMSFVADLRQAALTIGDVPQRNDFTPTDHENGSIVYTHDDSDMSFNFTLSILSFLMPYIGINKSL